MPFFNYTVKNQYGETLKGKVEAQTARHAASALNERGLLVVQIKPLTDDAFGELKASLFGVKHEDVVRFTRQLATMITAGLPLATSLSILVRQSKVEMSKLVATILQDIEGGLTFSKALAKHPKVFSRIYVQLVYAGETGGVLDGVLERLAVNMEKEKSFRDKTKGAMIYPLIVILAMIAVGFIMMIWVVPQLTAIFRDFGAELPLATRVLIGVSDSLVRFWWLLAILLGVAFMGFLSWKKTRTGQVALGHLILRLPIVGDLVTKMIITEFSRTLAVLLGAGISVLHAIEIVGEGVDNLIFREAILEVKDQVEKGVPLSQALERYVMFPPILSQMIKVGEETGKMDEVLFKLSEYYESETEQAVKNLTTAIEPLIMIVLGIGVGVMVFAIIMPIYNLTAQF